MDQAVLRDDMVDSLEHPTKGVVTTESVAIAMRTVPREQFVPDHEAAYADRDYRVFGTTVFAPSTVARFFEALHLEPSQRTLIVGSGVGYTAAIAAEIAGARNVHAIDLSHEIVYEARKNLTSAGYDSVLVLQGDGARGLPDYAPYDRILVETAISRPPGALQGQLASDGRLVAPIGSGVQELTAFIEQTEMQQYGTIAVEPMLIAGEQAGAIERNRMEREDRELADRAAQRRRVKERRWIDWEAEFEP